MSFLDLKSEFEKHLASIDWKPEIWFDDDYLELGFEWISVDKTRHAVVTFNGTDDYYGYCYLVDGSFVSGKEFDPHVSHFPDDLRSYLNDSLRSTRT